MTVAGAPDAAYAVDQLMRVVARSARRQVDVGCPHCPHLSHDEQRLLHAASLAQSGEADRTEKSLRSGMLSASGAEFALGPLEGLGELFLGADLMFRRRLLANGTEPADADAKVWMPPIPSTLH